MRIYTSEEGSLIKAFVDGVEFEDEARRQIFNIASLPFVYPHVAVMPDVHAGIGATVGSVIPTLHAVIPAAVGVDIGCGIIAIKTSLRASDLPSDLSALRSAVESAVPHGRTNNGGHGDKGAWEDTPDSVRSAFASLQARYAVIVDKHPGAGSRAVLSQLGTLGTGNHFIEVCLDENQEVWVMLHSGSRGVGNSIGRYFIEMAKREMEKWYISLPDTDLAYLPEGSEHFDDYIHAVEWAQDYASANRACMMASVRRVFREFFPQLGEDGFGVGVVSCHHNYISKENHGGQNVLVTRKGAVRARLGDLGVIPGSMGARSYIVKGKGNPLSLNSCSHGAGRRMSRAEAKRSFTVQDHLEATRGVECRKDADVIDETPMAYKNIDNVMEAQKDLVEIVHTLKQVLCVKG